MVTRANVITAEFAQYKSCYTPIHNENKTFKSKSFEPKCWYYRSIRENAIKIKTIGKFELIKRKQK